MEPTKEFERVLKKIAVIPDWTERREILMAVHEKALQEALQMMAWRIECNTGISELYGWQSIVETSREQTERLLGIKNREALEAKEGRK